jgi:hypothetical protein
MSPRHCERSEAIHLAATRKVDCFVALLLAMTVEIEFRSNQKQRKNLP